MQSMRWSVLCLALLALCSIGCGGSTAPVAGQSDAEAYFADNPDAAKPVEDTMESEGAPGS